VKDLVVAVVAVLFVAGGADGAARYVGPAEPYTTIQAAIDASATGDVIIVRDGTYTGPGNRDIDFAGKALHLRSENGPGSCIIDAQGTADAPHRGFYLHSRETSDAIIDGFTITHGYAAGDGQNDAAGGGILCSNASATITNNIITDCAAAAYGGGIACRYAPEVRIIANLITANKTFAATQAVDYPAGGAGIYCIVSSPVIEHNTITGNRNELLGYGAGVYLDTATPANIAHNVFLANVAVHGNGDALYVRDHYNTDTVVTVTNCIFWPNLPLPRRAIRCELYYSYSRMVIRHCDIDGGQSATEGGILQWEKNNLDSDPLFADPGHWIGSQLGVPWGDSWVNGDYHLKSAAGRWDPLADDGRGGWALDPISSPLIDAGDPASGFSSEPAPNGGRANIGLYGNTSQASRSCPADPPATLTVLSTDATGVSISGAISGATPFTAAIVPTTRIELMAASPTSGKFFLRWQDGNGALLSYHRRLDITVTADATVVAVFGTVTDFYVNDLTPDGDIAAGDDANPGTSPQTPMANIHELLRIYPSIGKGCTVHVAPGRYYGCVDVQNRAQMVVSGAGADSTIIDGLGRTSCLRILNCTGARVAGFTLTNGNAGKYGGGGAEVLGAGILSDCIIVNNRAGSSGGGIVCGRGAVIERNVIIGNSAQAPSSAGGGIFINDSPIGDQNIVRNNLIVGNQAAGKGGGVYINTASPLLINNTIVGNSAPQGGGVACWTSSGSLVNCIIWNNDATDGPEIAVSSPSGSLTVRRSDVRNGRAGVYAVAGGVLDWGRYNQDVDPMFADPDAGDYRLQSDSPCIDRGDYAAPAGDVDLAGLPRVAGFVVDPGAWECQNPDRVPPCVDAGPDRVVEQAKPAGSPVNLAADVRSWRSEASVLWYEGDALLGQGESITCLLASGEHLIEAHAIDADGHSEDDVAIQVVDTTPPAVEAGPDLLIERPTRDPVEVTLHGTVSDAADPAPIVEWYEDATLLGSGATLTHTFLPGRTILTLKSADVSGNVAQDTTAVQVSFVWYVDDDAALDPAPGDPSAGDPAEDGSPDHPFDAIQEAIHHGLDWDTIIVRDGTYTGTGNRDIDFKGKPIRLRSENGPANCTIDCQASSTSPARGFHFHTGETQFSIVDGFTITNGNIQYVYGGGIWIEAPASPTIANNVIVRNIAQHGGGIAVSGTSDSSAVIVNNFIAYNAATGGGGGVSCGWARKARLINNVIVKNFARSRCGGAELNSCGSVFNCTIADNLAAPNTDCHGVEASGAMIMNCIIWNISDLIPSAFLEGSYVRGSSTGYPHFVDPAAGDYHLRSYSPCIGAGINYYASEIASDLDGEPRIMFGNVDVGADEAAIASADTDADGLPDDWENAFLKTLATGPGDDPDGDGVTNLDEYIAGTNPAVDQAVVFVSAANAGDPLADGTLAHPFPSIQQGIDESCGTVKVAEGSYNELLLVDAKALDIQGGYSSDFSTRDPARFVSRVDARRSGSTVQYFNAPGGSLSGFLITGGSAFYGSGVCIGYSSLTITDNVITDNLLADALHTSGAGVYAYRADLAIARNTISLNHDTNYNAGNYGGGMYIWLCSGMISDNIISGNAARSGGGIAVSGGTPEFRNNVLCANRATSVGGGIYIRATALSLANNTIADNTALGGGGIRVFTGNHLITNCILWGNTANTGPQISTDTVLTIHHCDLAGGAADIYHPSAPFALGDGVISDDPLFADPAGGDYHVKSRFGRWDPSANAGTGAWIADDFTSPCIDAGDPGSDFSSEPMPNFARVNIGAYGNTVEASRSGWNIPGDTNGDCRVNILDLIFIRNKLNLDAATDDNWKGDVNNDTRINILDLIFVRNKLNTACP